MKRPARALLPALGLAFVVAACSSAAPAEPREVVVTSIVEIPGPTVTSIVTETSIIEVTVTTPVDPRADWPDTLVFGVPTGRQDQGSLPGSEAFASAVGSALGLRIIVVGAQTEASLATALEGGDIDFAPIRATTHLLAQRAGAEIEVLAQSVRFGDSTYHSLWLTNDPTVCGADPVEGAFYYDDEGAVIAVGPTETPALQVGWNPDGSRDDQIAAGLRCPEPVSLEVVMGKRVAFTTETSPTGYLIPVMQLRRLEITDDEYSSVFLGSHDLVVDAVISGQADVGVTFDDARQALVSQDPEVGTKAIAFNLSPRIANDVLTIRTDLPESLKAALLDALVGYASTADGQQAMSLLFGWTYLEATGPDTTQSLETVAAAMDELGFGS